jgi:single-strand DNA-binding protein
MNKSVTVVVGGLTKDVEVREVNGKKVANATVAVSREYKNADGNYDSDFYDVECWNSAEYFGKGVKGQEVTVTGRMEQRSYTDKEGKRRTSWTLKAQTVSLGAMPGGGNAAPAEEDDADFPPF